jgi:hypothetical protein
MYKDGGDDRRHKEKIRKGGKEGSNSGNQEGGREAKTEKVIIGKSKLKIMKALEKGKEEIKKKGMKTLRFSSGNSHM